MAQTQAGGHKQGTQKQNWLLTGVAVGSIILALLGWTRKVDCGCPKDLNASVSSAVKGLGEGLGQGSGAKPVDAKGLAIRVGAPDQGRAGPLGRPAVLGTGTGPATGPANLVNTRGPLGVGRGIGTGGAPSGSGNLREDGSPFDGSGNGFARTNGTDGIGSNTPRGTSGGSGNPNGGSGGGAGGQLQPNGQPAGTTTSGSGGSQGTGSTSGGSQIISTSTSGGVTSTTSSGGQAGASGGAISSTGGTTTGGTTTGGTSSSSGGSDPFGPRDPNLHPRGDHDGQSSGGRGPAGGSGGINNPGGGSGGHRPDRDGENGRGGNGGGGRGNGWFDGFHFGDKDHGSGATDVPEPGTFGLMGIGVAGLGFASWRRRRSKASDKAQPEATPAEGEVA